MSLQDLQRDLKANRAEAQRLLVTDPENPLLRHLVNTMWPYQEAVLEEMSEQAEQLDELVEQTGDLIQPETAAVFAAVVLLNARLCDELEGRLGPSESELRGVIKAAREAGVEASTLLEEITLPPAGDDDDDEDDDDEDDDGEEGDDVKH